MKPRQASRENACANEGSGESRFDPRGDHRRHSCDATQVLPPIDGRKELNNVTSRMTPMTPRRRWTRPQSRIARGVAVFGSSAARSIETIDGTLPESGRLRSWSFSHGVTLTDDSKGLDDLDGHLDEWRVDPTHFEQVDLGNEIGIHLGNVIVRNVTGAKWRVLANGHPVISLASAQELDVIVMVGDRLRSSDSRLSAIYRSASST